MVRTIDYASKMSSVFTISAVLPNSGSRKARMRSNGRGFHIKTSEVVRCGFNFLPWHIIRIPVHTFSNGGSCRAEGTVLGISAIFSRIVQMEIGEMGSLGTCLLMLSGRTRRDSFNKIETSY